MLASAKLNGLAEGVAAGAACEGPGGVGLAEGDPMRDLFADDPDITGDGG
jgi:hypothetical protein